MIGFWLEGSLISTGESPYGIAFCSNRSGSWQIYRADSSSSEAVPLTACKGDYQMGWLRPDPSGLRIAFELERLEEPWGLALCVVDTRKRQQRISVERPKFCSPVIPRWSPDGTRIVFATNVADESNLSLYLTDEQGRHLKRLTGKATNDGDPAWSPDGNTVAFSSAPATDPEKTAGGRKGGNWGIWALNVKNGSRECVCDSPEPERSPAFSPDGRRLAFLRNGLLFIWDVERKSEKLVSTLLKNCGRLHWSPNGDSILVREGGTWFYLVSVESGKVRKLPRDMGDHGIDAVFDPEGKAILYVTERVEQGKDEETRMYLLDLLSWKRRVLLDYGELGVVSSGSLSWSPDGRRIAFVVIKGKKDRNFEVYTLDIKTGEIVNISENPAVDTSPIWIRGR